jgi:hypothetical protein
MRIEKNIRLSQHSKAHNTKQTKEQCLAKHADAQQSNSHNTNQTEHTQAMPSKHATATYTNQWD